MPNDIKGVKLVYASSRVNPLSYYYDGYFDSRTFMMRKVASPVHKVGNTFSFLQGNNDGQLDFRSSSGYNPSKIRPIDHSLYLTQGFMQDGRDWTDVECTVYATMKSAPSNGKLVWRVRTGLDRLKSGDCESCGYEAELAVDGRVRFIKRQYSGSSDYKPYSIATSDIENRTVGFKFIIHNTKRKYSDSVSLEIWLDENNDNIWRRKHLISDTSGWGNFGNHCRVANDQIINWGGPIISGLWVADDVPEAVDFTNLSIREIDPTARFFNQEGSL